jgi:hypothetical protein
MSIAYLDAPLEWIRLGSSEERRAAAWLEPNEIDHVKIHMPGRTVQILKQSLSHYFGDSREAVTWRRKFLEGLGYGGSFVDLTGPLAMEQEKQRRTVLEASQPESPGELMIPDQPNQKDSSADSGQAG